MSRRALLAVTMTLAAVASGCGLIGGGGGNYTLIAYFPRAVSLFPTSDVRVLGLPAGTVTDVEVIGDRVKVTMHVNDDIPVPADVKAAIIPQSLIGERYVQLMPTWQVGQPKAEDGHEIQLDDTIIPVEPDEALEALKEFLDSLDPDGLGRLIGNLAEGLEGNGATLNSAIENVSQLVTTLADKDQELVGLVENFDAFTATLVTRDQQIGEILDAFAAATGVLADERQSIEALVGGLADLSVNALDLVAEHSVQLRTDVETLTRLGRSIDVNLAAVAQLLDAGPLLVSGLNAAWNPELRAFDLRNQFGPLAQQVLQPILSAIVPGIQVPCVPLPGTGCLAPLTVEGQSAGRAVPATIDAAPPTPIDAILALLASPSRPLAPAASPSVGERVAGGASDVGGFLAGAVRTLLGMAS